MPTLVDREQLLVTTNPQGVLFWPHPHIYPWDKPAMLMSIARIRVPHSCRWTVWLALVVCWDGRISQSFCSQTHAKLGHGMTKLRAWDALEIFPRKSL